MGPPFSSEHLSEIGHLGVRKRTAGCAMKHSPESYLHATQLFNISGTLFAIQSSVSSGVYFARMQAGNYSKTQKMLYAR